jgi:hypothetical protein
MYISVYQFALQVGLETRKVYSNSMWIAQGNPHHKLSAFLNNIVDQVPLPVSIESRTVFQQS